MPDEEGGTVRRVSQVLCATDLSMPATRELDVAIEVCALLEARLVVVHHRDDVAPGFTTEEAGRQGCRPDEMSDKVARHLADALRRLEGRVSVIATPGAAVEKLAATLPVEMLLLGSHGASPRDPPSLAERTIAHSATAVLVLHDDDVNGTQLRFRRGPDEPLPRVLVALDFTSATRAAIDWVMTFARVVPLDLHLIHVLPTGTTLARAAITGRPPADLVDMAQARLRALVPDDLPGRRSCYAEWGDPAAVIAACADRIGPDLLVMGQHARVPFAGLATRDTAHALLHRAWCPVLFVPPRWNGAP
jgi:nucleotide-binding universal stress UspA family protein